MNQEMTNTLWKEANPGMVMLECIMYHHQKYYHFALIGWTNFNKLESDNNIFLYLQTTSL